MESKSFLDSLQIEMLVIGASRAKGKVEMVFPVKQMWLFDDQQIEEKQSTSEEHPVQMNSNEALGETNHNNLICIGGASN